MDERSPLLPFRDRTEAGRLLAIQLQHHARRLDVLVLALPRGGVPVAAEVAIRLAAPLDLFLVRKLGVPGHEELAMGAIGTGGVLMLNESVIAQADVSPWEMEDAIAREQAELDRRELLYRDGRPPPAVQGRVVILVDDGLATGASMRAAAVGVRRQGAAAVGVAAPVAAEDTCQVLRALADEVVCLATPEPFHSVGSWSVDFSETSDDEVVALLAAAGPRRPSGGADARPVPR